MIHDTYEARRRRHRASARSRRAAVVIAALVAWPLVVQAEGDPVEQTARGRAIAVFDDIARADSGFGLRAWVNQGDGAAIPIGGQVQYHFVADRDANLVVVHLDSHGVATLIYPNAIGTGNALRKGVQRTFPSIEDGFEVLAEPPIGHEHVIVVATAAPVGPDDLGVRLGDQAIAVSEAAEAPGLAERLRDLYLATPPADRAAVHFEQPITARSAETQYTQVDIVDYFTTRTRSIRRPKLDLHVHFATGSDALDPTSRQSLDEMADALDDPRMRDMRFTVAGHTDSVGEMPYNDDLSRRRADSVVEYLVERHGIERTRLEVGFYGERRPIESNDTADGRRLNRRVEFELLR